jgi:hypothetical protein
MPSATSRQRVQVLDEAPSWLVWKNRTRQAELARVLLDAD